MFSRMLFAVILSSIIVAFTLGCDSNSSRDAQKSSGSSQSASNSENVKVITHGQTIDIEDFVEPGVYTVFDFYSEYCPPCVQFKPTVEELAEVSDEIVLRVVDINREGHRGIDWKSPVAVQYGMNSIPHFKIYDKEGNKMLEGNDARKWVQEQHANLDSSD